MPYPYIFSEFTTPNNTAYADIQAVQAYLLTYKISDDEILNTRQIHEWLISCTREIDAVFLKTGLQVPPPANSPILAILQQTCAVGTVALICGARHETGDEQMGMYANAMTNAYDSQLGLLERGDISGVQLGMFSSGWNDVDDTRLLFRSGNQQPDRQGNARVPYFTSTDTW